MFESGMRKCSKRTERDPASNPESEVAAREWSRPQRDFQKAPRPKCCDRSYAAGSLCQSQRATSRSAPPTSAARNGLSLCIPERSLDACQAPPQPDAGLLADPRPKRHGGTVLVRISSHLTREVAQCPEPCSSLAYSSARKSPTGR